MGLPAIATALTAVSSGVSVYQTYQQSQDAQRAAKFNAEQARQSARVAQDDSRNNALRTQEQHRKHIAALRAHMFEKSGAIEGGDRDFMNETVGDLQLRILDNSAMDNRNQANYANQAFSYDYQAKQAKRAGALNTGAAVLNGFASTYGAGAKYNFWGNKKSALNV